MQLPMSFQVRTQADADIKNPWTMVGQSSETLCRVPAEFGGEAKDLSPEDLFAMSLASCFVGTFKAYAAASKLTFSDLKVNATLKLDKTQEKQVQAMGCHIEIDLMDPSDEAKAKFLFGKVVRSGILLNSVKTELQYAFSINGNSISQG